MIPGFNLSTRKMAFAETGNTGSTMGKACSPAAFSPYRPILIPPRGYSIPASSDECERGNHHPLHHSAARKAARSPVFTPKLIPTIVSNCTASLLHFYPTSLIARSLISPHLLSLPFAGCGPHCSLSFCTSLAELPHHTLQVDQHCFGPVPRCY